VLDIPRYGCLNVHASLLPRWRGAAPIQRAMLAGDAETGVTIMQMDAGLDTGDMLMRIPTEILPEDNGETLHDRLADMGANALILTLTELQLERVQPVAQDDAGSNYARKLDKSEAKLDWSLPAVDLWNKIRAFNPWPVAQTQWEDKTLRIWKATLTDRVSKAVPGAVIAGEKGCIDVATGDGVLRITELQMPGKRPMAARDFLNAHNLAGVVLG
jgi:methionyl-tRNA formyltransferase